MIKSERKVRSSLLSLSSTTSIEASSAANFSLVWVAFVPGRFQSVVEGIRPLVRQFFPQRLDLFDKRPQAVKVNVDTTYGGKLLGCQALEFPYKGINLQ
jgi:hypothetical protein